MNIGNAIKQIRTDKNISQAKLAELTGISPTSLSQIENGIKSPSTKNRNKICSALLIPEALIYFYGLEKSDVNVKNKKTYDIVYPAIMDMVRKLLL